MRTIDRAGGNLPHRHAAPASTQHLIFRTDGKPLRFAGGLLGARTILDEENGDPEPDLIQRADGLVISGRDPAPGDRHRHSRRALHGRRVATVAPETS